MTLRVAGLAKRFEWRTETEQVVPMAFDDLRLIFETERRLLKRRVRELWGTRSAAVPRTATSASPPTAARSRATRAPSNPRNPSPRTVKPFRRRIKRRTPRGAGPRGSAVSLLNLLVSMVLHGIVLAIVFSYFPPKDGEPAPRSLDVTVRWVMKERSPKPEPKPPAPQAEKETTPEIKPEPQPVTTPKEEQKTPPAPPAPPKPSPRLHGTGGGGPAAGPRSRIGARSGEKAEALRIHGGGDETEVAVGDGLRWLARHQDPDGSWDPDGFTRHCPPGLACGGPGYSEYRVGVTGLVLLAFLGAGVDGKAAHAYRDNVVKGMAYLVTEQDEAGCVGPRRSNYMYNHSIATFCLAEAALLAADPLYRETAERGLRFSSAAQQPQGGWDYTSARTLRNDLSITGWQVMAIQAAEMAEIPVDSGMKRRLHRYIRRAVRNSGWATYADRGIGAQRGGISIASVGLLSKLYLGWSPRSPELLRTAELIIRHPPDADARVDWEATFQSSYYWYYATLSLFHLGGDLWEAWNTLLKRELLAIQRRQGERKGSWDPDPNWIGASGGRIATTALNVLSFEVYYRYKPLYRKFGLTPASPGGPR